MTNIKEIIKAAVAAFNEPPESVVVIDECGNEWTFVQERICHHVDDGVPWCDEEFTCSECGATTNITMSSQLTISEGELHYCPNCGAKVVEE